MSLFNRAQLATWDEARHLALTLSSGALVVGGGVRPETQDARTSGVYVPTWLGGPAGFGEPAERDEKTGREYFWIHFRFLNGAEGVNAGLILDRLRRYPTASLYVLSALAAEVEGLARERKEE
jgi:hypothetical protein